MRTIKLPQNKTIRNREVFFNREMLPNVEVKNLLDELDKETAQLNIYDEIGFFGITAKQVRDSLTNAKKKGYKNIVVNINSPGGDVFDGIAIFNDLFNFNGKVTVEITGLAASAATVIAMAGDEIVMAENASFMIHNAWGFSIGNKNDMREMADVLDKIDDSIAMTYAAKASVTKEEALEMMDKETWLDASEAYDFGFVTKVRKMEEKEPKNMLFDLSAFNNVPAEIKQRIENSLHDAGYSRRIAKAAVSEGFSILEKRDASQGSPEQRDVVKESSELLASLSKLRAQIQS